MNEAELKFIREAAAFLESPNLFIRGMNLLGRPVEALEHRLPERAADLVRRATRRSLEGALAVALKTLPANVKALNFESAQRMAGRTGKRHMVSTAVTGGVAGLFGVVALPLELPVTTTLMLRSIAGIAADFGANLEDPAERLECLYVFTLGTPSPGDDSTDTSYYASRIAFTQLVAEAARYVSGVTVKEALFALERGAAPALVRLVSAVATRFNLAVTEKILAEAIPVIGAAGGAAINALFSDYFNSAARFHFGLKKLENLHGAEVVRAAYASAAPRLS